MKTNIFRTLSVVILSALSLVSFVGHARKIKTKHTVPKTLTQTREKTDVEEANIISLESDSIGFCTHVLPNIRFYGFDKTVGSNSESFFITNGLETPISGIEVEITYNDMKGRQLHKRNAKIECEIPSGETLRTDIKSWDTQKSFYFHQSAKPRRQATPFDVKMRILSVTITSNVKRPT